MLWRLLLGLVGTSRVRRPVDRSGAGPGHLQVGEVVEQHPVHELVATTLRRSSTSAAAWSRKPT